MPCFRVAETHLKSYRKSPGQNLKALLAHFSKMSFGQAICLCYRGPDGDYHSHQKFHNIPKTEPFVVRELQTHKKELRAILRKRDFDAYYSRVRELLLPIEVLVM